MGWENKDACSCSDGSGWDYSAKLNKPCLPAQNCCQRFPPHGSVAVLGEERARRWLMNLTTATFPPSKSIWKRLCVVDEAELMGEVDQAWLRSGAVKALQVSGCLGLPERESWVLFISCAFRLHLFMLSRIAPLQLLKKTWKPKSFLRATILHLAKELCHLLELHLDLAHLKPWESLPEQGVCLQTCFFDLTT